VDGAFDTSHWLLNKRGFLPVPIIITEPTIGYGGGAALLWFHRSKRDKERAEAAPDEPLGLPPSISFAFGFGTENETWGAGGGHFGTWFDDRVRYLGAAAYTSANLDFYIAGRSLDYNLEGVYVFQQLQFRLGKSDFFLGPRYQFSKFDSTFEFDIGPGGLEAGFTQENSALGVIARYDSRDNILAPSRGQDFKIIGDFFSESLGGSTEHQKLQTELISYHPLPGKLNLGVRVAGEFELRWNVYERWSLVGFFGVGWTAGPRSDRNDPGAIPAGGGGIRYLIARLIGFQVGVDVAASAADTTFYIQAGNSW
jgi:hypothetical protein